MTAVAEGCSPQQADLWIAANGADFRTEFFCLPSAGFNWPRSAPPAVTWTVQWADSTAFTGCAPGETLQSYSVNLMPQ